MRLTNSTLLRGYNRDMQRLKTEKNACERKITSTRKFSRASEAPLSAAKALNVRKSQYYSAQYKENLKVASKFYTEAETSLLQVSEKMAEIRETIIAAVNTTKDTVDYNIYAQQLETYAHELCAIFNTDSAGRAIFGGESDASLPFTIINDANGSPATVLYHGVPVNAMSDYKGFPYSNRVYMDIGLGMVTDQQTHAQDPMSVLDISFNGAQITGCGTEYGVADIDLTSILQDRNYAIDVYADGVKRTIAFRGTGNQADDVKQINELLREAYSKEISAGKTYPMMDKQGMVYLVKDDAAGNPIAVENGNVCVVNNTSCADSYRTEQLVVENDSNYTNKYKIGAGSLAENTLYVVDVEVNGERKQISFMSGADDFTDPANPVFREDVTIANMQKALDEVFGEGVVNLSTHAPNKGVISTEGGTVKLVASKEGFEDENGNAAADADFERERIYSNNYIQLTLDAARALRRGDIEYANGCIDRIVNASENLLATIADIGSNEDFVDFNIERLTTREENLAERQNELEITDPEYEITLWKTFEAYYNACLQMSASVVPNSIFNYMK